MYAPCGSCLDCIEKTRRSLSSASKKRNRVTYGLGLPTRARPVKGAKVHEVVHNADGKFSIGDPPVTREKLLRHVEKFGAEGVAEIAKWELGDSDLKTVRAKAKTETKKRPKKQRHTTTELREQVLELHKRGRRVMVIADVLNISDARVQAILSEAEAA